MSCVYVYKNKLNSKCYVGQTVNKLERRFRQHLNYNDNYPFHRALKKYGREGFDAYVFFMPEILLDEVEKTMIIRLKSLKPSGYNIQLGGKINKKHHPETIEKIRRSRIGKRNLSFGYRMSEEAKRNLSIACKGRISSFKGKKHTTEAIEKQRNARINHWKTHIHPNTGKQFTDEFKKKLSESKKGLRYNIGISFTEERKQNIRNALKKRYANGLQPWNKGRKIK